jgi:hypothetical protein
MGKGHSDLQDRMYRRFPMDAKQMQMQRQRQMCGKERRAGTTLYEYRVREFTVILNVSYLSMNY